MNLELERMHSLARALATIGALTIVACIVAGFALLKRDLHALDVRLSKLDAQVNAPMRDPTPAEWTRMVRESEAWSAAKDRETDAIRKCRAMGQAVAIGPGTEGGPRIVCLQAPTIAFDFDPEWPDR